MFIYKIKDIGTIVSGGTPKTTENDYWNGDISWITPKDLSTNKSKYIHYGERNITDKGLSHSSSKMLPKGTVLLTSRAPIGYLAIAGKDLCTNQGFKSIICNTEIIKPEYLYYLLNTKIDDLISISTGSTFLELSKSVFEEYQIKIHNLEEQQHIIDTIGSIDDLIENNNTIIIKLENIILNLYRKKSIEWKKQVKIGDLFKCILGGTPSTKKNEYWDGDIAWVNSGEVNKLRIVSPSRYITKDGLENSATKLLPKKTTVIAITGATLGQVSLLEIDSCTNQSVIGILENNTLKHDFIYPMMINAIKKLVLNKTGGAQQHINKNDVETFEIFVPSEIEYFEYSQIIQPIFEYQSKLILQNKELLLLKNKYLQKFFG